MEIRRAWCAAALIAATGIAGCGESGGASATHSPIPNSQITLIGQLPIASPDTTSPASVTPSLPATPEEKINTIAEERGWALGSTNDDDSILGLDDSSLYDSPAAFVQDICDSLPDQADSGPAQWLAENQASTPDEMQILTVGIPLLCPEWTKTVRQAVSGHYPVYIGSGTYKVTSHRADDTVPPGTYRTTGDLEGCYWERTKADGTIIDNNFATAATRITVTILPSDDLFTSQDCGTWGPVD
ncbi:hypothetical protein [Actinacidiphila sp. ITFR-21]|uniref:hypothetical protein n=1 Tax=Actinacidiphila sp. ITFR-21 TaxID=3075199 RepID=UPI002889EC1D|nr:hypothetical protein [Streptomyces sp. ITFR-21]WNI19187.1 hypothetical protein RLT57_29030 [Streptomyces sp. ITFR-21]